MQVYKFLSAPNAPVEGTLMYKFMFCDIQVLIIKKVPIIQTKKKTKSKEQKIKRRVWQEKLDKENTYAELMSS